MSHAASMLILPTRENEEGAMRNHVTNIKNRLLFSKQEEGQRRSRQGEREKGTNYEVNIREEKKERRIVSQVKLQEDEETDCSTQRSNQVWEEGDTPQMMKPQAHTLMMYPWDYHSYQEKNNEEAIKRLLHLPQGFPESGQVPDPSHAHQGAWLAQVSAHI
ncbi:hypothetical protein NDU88_002390 [Pleurodeles waltl]|uniref:Uncharacterized protein n=1 Tax=Pleurodeles waltl TaxID=8319 RepID=A0AAV7MN77_PLEWA|nr:hypothetical protein NDU88_002390 [Pleurodeles waltl]